MIIDLFDCDTSSTVNRRAENGATPVYFTAQEGQLPCLQFLVAQVGSAVPPSTSSLHLPVSRVSMCNCRLKPTAA